MTHVIHRWMRWFAPIILALGLTLSPAPTRQVLAQVPDPDAAAEPGGGGGKGRPYDGYIGTSCLVALALFIVAKSARR
jgi:hypothetical protein